MNLGYFVHTKSIEWKVASSWDVFSTLSEYIPLFITNGAIFFNADDIYDASSYTIY